MRRSRASHVARMAVHGLDQGGHMLWRCELADAMPQIEVDPETSEVRADGELLTCEPASELPFAQRYFLF